MIVLKRLVLALLPVVLFGLYAQYPALAWTAVCTVTPWIVLYTDDRSPRVSWGYYVLGAYVSWLAINAEAFRFGWYAAIGMGITYLPAWIPFAPALAFVHRRLRLPRWLSAAVLWVACEWLRVEFVPGHFDLYALGYSLARFPVLIQVVDVVGVYGLSFVLAAINGWWADAYFAWRERESASFRAELGRRGLVRAAAGIVLVILGIVVYGVVRLATVTHRDGPRLAIVQPNAPHTQSNMVGVHLSQLVLTEREVPTGAADLIVWPENAIMDDIRREGVYLDDLAWMAQRKDAWFLVGALGKPDGQPGKTTNGAYLVDQDGRVVEQYDKRLLFPWGEYVPFDGLIGRVTPGFQRFHRELTRAGWGFLPTGVAGRSNAVFELPWEGGTVSFATLICNENTYPPFPAESGTTEATFFINITSEGTVGGPVQEQLLRIAILRAVENRMSYVRAGNTGISATIDATGKVREVLRGPGGATIETRAVMITRVPIHDGGSTWYAVTGDGFVKVVLVAATMLLVGAIWRGRRRLTGTTVVASIVLCGSCASPPDLGTDPALVDEQVLRGRTAFANGDCRSTIEALSAACATAEGCRLGLDVLATCFERGVAHERAVIVFDEIVRRYPEVAPRALLYRGTFESLIHDLESALASYRQSLELEPNTVASGKLGNLLVRMGETTAAIEVFRQGLENDPESTDLRFVLGRALRSIGETDEAERLLAEVLDRRPDHAAAWVELGKIRQLRGDASGAGEAFRTALRSDPESIDARFMLARAALRRGEVDRVDPLIAEIERIESGFGRGPRSYD